MSTYAIGDIQGCFDSFMRLLERCCFDPAVDRLWLVGDLVNRGPRSLETLRFVKGLGGSALTVLGNHDLTLLLVAEGFCRPGRGDTFDDILRAPDREDLLFWLRQQPLCYVENGYCLVHAGLLPQWTAAQARALAGEVETALRAEGWREFLARLWGNDPVAWCEDLCGWPRLRVIVNAMTRLRFCTPEGVMDFRAKGGLESAPPGYIPWFEAPGRKSAGTTLVTGHWSALGLNIRPDLLGLDSGCLWGGVLSAVRLEDRMVFQVTSSAEEAQKPSPSKIAAEITVTKSARP